MLQGIRWVPEVRVFVFLQTFVAGLLSEEFLKERFCGLSRWAPGVIFFLLFVEAMVQGYSLRSSSETCCGFLFLKLLPR